MANDKKTPAKSNANKPPVKTPGLGRGTAERASQAIQGYYAKQKKALDEI